MRSDKRLGYVQDVLGVILGYTMDHDLDSYTRQFQVNRALLACKDRLSPTATALCTHTKDGYLLVVF